MSVAASPALNLDASPDIEVKKEDGTDDEDVKMSEDEVEGEKPSPPTPANGTNGDTLKRKRSHDEDIDMKDENDESKSPMKRLKSHSPPPPPPPPPAPPSDGTPAESVEASPTVEGVHLHSDTSFKSKTMADVLAEAQQDTAEEGDVPMEEETNGNGEKGIRIKDLGAEAFSMGNMADKEENVKVEESS